MNIDILLYVLAFVFFCLGGFNVPAGVNWQNLGFATLTASLFLP